MNSHAYPPSIAPRRGAALVRCALLLFGVAITLITVEIALRLVTKSTFLSVAPVLVSRGLAYAPGQRQRYKTPEWDIEIATNEQGFRDGMRAPADGTAGSILVLGSSFVEGHGVNLEDTFPKQLQRDLKSRGQDVWVYNAGFHGSNITWQSRIYREVFRSRTDLKTVILGLCLAQDIASTTQPEELPTVTPPGTPWKVFLGEHSALYNVVNRKVKSSAQLRRTFRFAGLTPSSDILAQPPYDAAATAPLLDRALDQIRSLARDVTADGRRLVIVLLPTKEQVNPAFLAQLLADSRVPREKVDLMGAQERARTALTEAGLTVFDATPLLSAPPAEVPDYFFQSDRHYTPRGHARVAAGLALLLAAAR